MKNLSFYALVVLMIIALYGAAFAQAGDNPGKKVFTDKKCSMCHAVKSLTITTKGKGPDLSAVGATQKADFLNKYLMKQEKIKNKLHPTPFKGTPDDLKNLCAWLATLKK